MRSVVCTEARAWLQSQPALSNVSFVTSLPDVSELAEHSLDQWRAWFTETVERIVLACPEDGVAIFYQTDVFRHGTWIDKGQLCHTGAERAGAALLWHKIVCNAPPDHAVVGRPGYAHMLCFSRGVRVDAKLATPDVISETGTKDWSRAMGRNACNVACAWVRVHTTSTTIIDPFCGTGNVLAAANALGLNAIGVEIDPARAERATRRR